MVDTFYSLLLWLPCSQQTQYFNRLFVDLSIIQSSSDRPAPFSDYGLEKKMRAERDQIELREQILRQQQMIE